MTREQLAKFIVKKQLENLKDRRGFRHLIEEIELDDKETYDEIVDTLEDIVVKAIIYNEN